MNIQQIVMVCMSCLLCSPNLLAGEVSDYLTNIFRVYEEFYNNCELQATLEVNYSDAVKKDFAAQLQKTEKRYSGHPSGGSMAWKCRDGLMCLDTIFPPFPGKSKLGADHSTYSISNGVTLRFNKYKKNASIMRGICVSVPTPLQCAGLALPASDGNDVWWRALSSASIAPSKISDLERCSEVAVQIGAPYYYKVQLSRAQHYVPIKLEICDANWKILRVYQYEWEGEKGPVPLIKRVLITSFKDRDSNLWYTEIWHVKEVKRSGEINTITVNDLPPGTPLYDGIARESMVIGDKMVASRPSTNDVPQPKINQTAVGVPQIQGSGKTNDLGSSGSQGE